MGGETYPLQDLSYKICGRPTADARVSLSPTAVPRTGCRTRTPEGFWRSMRKTLIWFLENALILLRSGGAEGPSLTKGVGYEEVWFRGGESLRHR